MCAFIALEGPDCSGTTKQTGLLAQKFTEEQLEFVQTFEPANNKIGNFIRQLLFERPLPSPDAFQLLYCADRAHHHAEVIQPALKQNKHILCERSSLSTCIYGEATGVDPTWLKQVNSKFTEPDLIIITLPPFAVCKERLLKREQRDELEKIDFQQKVYDLYAKQTGENIVFVDTSGPLEETAATIWNIVQPLITDTVK